VVAVAPDGQHLAFIARFVGSRGIWIRPLGALTARAVPGTEGARDFVWAPDGDSIAFVTQQDGRRRIDLSGGPPRKLAELGRGTGAWSNAGVILFRGRDGRIYRTDDTGGEAEAVTELDPDRDEIAHYPEFFLSDGRRFVFRARSGDRSHHGVYLSSLNSMSRTTLLDTLSSVELTDGRLVYQRAGTLRVQPFDEDAGRVTGQAVAFVDGVGYDPVTGKGAFSVSRSGVLAYGTGGNATTSVLTWFDRSGAPLDQIHDFAGSFLERGSLSADNHRLAVSHRAEGESADVWLVDLGRGVPTRFTFDAGDDEAPVFSPDGTRVVFASNRTGVSDLYERSSGGAQEATLLYQSPNENRPWAFSPDGNVLLFDSPTKSAGDIWSLPLEGEREAFPVVSTGFPAGYAVFSPDGRWFAYCEGDSGADQVYVQPYPPDGTRVRLSTTNGSSPQWRGKEVFYATADNHVMAVDVTNPLEPGISRELFVAPGTLSHNAILVDSTGSRFLMPVPTGERQAAQIHVVLNWFSELERLVPTK
jgi:eukaryotic-like serine/threonine-protein kinase